MSILTAVGFLVGAFVAGYAWGTWAKTLRSFFD